MSEDTGCNCKSNHEHTTLVHRVDASYKKDDQRARLRTARNTQALRERVLSELYGHNGKR